MKRITFALVAIALVGTLRGQDDTPERPAPAEPAPAEPTPEQPGEPTETPAPEPEEKPEPETRVFAPPSVDELRTAVVD